MESILILYKNGVHNVEISIFKATARILIKIWGKK